jgi:hypothetical protein
VGNFLNRGCLKRVLLYVACSLPGHEPRVALVLPRSLSPPIPGIS